MRNRQKHMEYWIEDLKSYGINEGPEGESLESMDYYDLRSYLVKAQLHRDLEVKASAWF